MKFEKAMFCYTTNVVIVLEFQVDTLLTPGGKSGSQQL